VNHLQPTHVSVLGTVLVALAALGTAPSATLAAPTLPLPPPRGYGLVSHSPLMPRGGYQPLSEGTGRQHLLGQGVESRALNPQPLPPGER
jgi:hypothetical protein